MSSGSNTSTVQRYPVVDYRRNTVYAVTGPGRPGPVGTLVHTTDGIDSLSWLTGGSAAEGAPAGADCLITREGKRYELCPPGRYPYHAGKSEVFLSRWYRGNDVSKLLLGPEVEALASQDVLWVQIDSLAEYVVEKALLYGWRWPFVIFGHGGEATPAGRRSDPRHFDWGALMGRLYLRSKLAGIAGM